VKIFFQEFPKPLLLRLSLSEHRLFYKDIYLESLDFEQDWHLIFHLLIIIRVIFLILWHSLDPLFSVYLDQIRALDVEVLLSLALLFTNSH